MKETREYGKKSLGDRFMELTKLIVFALAMVGGITVLAYHFKVNHGETVIPVGFFSQILIYVAIAMVGITIAGTDIIFSRLGQVWKIAIAGVLCYVMLLAFLYNTPVAPLKDILSFLVMTGWFLANTIIVCTGWYVYELMMSAKYDKCLADYKSRNT